MSESDVISPALKETCPNMVSCLFFKLILRDTDHLERLDEDNMLLVLTRIVPNYRISFHGYAKVR